MERLNNATALLLARSPPGPWLKGVCTSSASPPLTAAHQYPGWLRTARTGNIVHVECPA